MKFIKLFENHSNYEDFVDGGTMEKPNVSHCIQENHVHYNPIYNPKNQYFTIEALDDGEITFVYDEGVDRGFDQCTYMECSKDGGKTWTRITEADRTMGDYYPLTVEVSEGDEVMFRGINKFFYYEAYEDFSSGGHFSFSTPCNVKGNILSLLYGENFKGRNDLPELEEYYDEGMAVIPYVFKDLFVAGEGPGGVSSCNIISAKDLILPSTTLTSRCYSDMFRGCSRLTVAPELPATTLAYACYSGMFSGCTSLTTAPKLPALTLTDKCYSFMFQNCSSLNYIKAMFTTTPGTSYTSNWVNGVAASGTFVKNSAAQWNVTGVNGIPSGWTVQNT